MLFTSMFGREPVFSTWYGRWPSKFWSALGSKILLRIARGLNTRDKLNKVGLAKFAYAMS